MHRQEKYYSWQCLLSLCTVSGEDIVTTASPGELEPDPGPLPPGFWPGSGQLPRTSLQDRPGLPGLAGGLPGLGGVLL